MKTEISEQSIAKGIYNQFTKGPIIEMVQYMVDHSVDAQILHQLKVIEAKNHKNLSVKSYAEKIYDAYERVCKVLVTYPSLEFKNHQFELKEKKIPQFINEYYGEQLSVSKEIIMSIIELGNMSMNALIESNIYTDVLIFEIINSHKDIDHLATFLKEICGDDYRHLLVKVHAEKNC